MSNLSKRNDDWITDEKVPDPEGLNPKGWITIVRPLSPRKTTKGGIIIPDQLQDDIQYLTTVGKVLAIGPLAFTQDDLLEPVIDPEGYIVGHKFNPWYQVGDYVTYAKYAGAKRIYKGVKLLFLARDTEVLDVISDPHDIDSMYNLGG